MERSLNGEEQPKKQLTITEYFNEAFAIYLSYGMSYEEFWEKESWLVKAYRKAKKIKNEEANYLAWLHGVYVLEALQSGIPVVLNGIAKEHIQLPKFPEKPLDFEAQTKEQREKKQMELQKARMKEMAERFNAVFLKKHGGDAGKT